MEGMAQVVAQAVHSIWEGWSERLQVFPKERQMQCAFKDLLSERLPAGWSVRRPAGWSARRGGGLSPRYSAWTAYDIGVVEGDHLVALLELSLRDTNVGHALHNGELKLLGNCSGIGVSTGKPFSTERVLAPEGIGIVQGRLERIPVRGLFFINPGPGPVLDQPEDAMWWETKAKGFTGESRFWSALFAPEKKATLGRVFERLAQAGLYCWFYSLCGEPSIEYLPPPSVTGPSSRSSV
jgi:hypothetical protein